MIDLDLYARVVDFFDQLELAGKSGPSICTRQNHHMAQKHRRSEGRRVTADSIGAPGLSQNAGTTTRCDEEDAIAFVPDSGWARVALAVRVGCDHAAAAVGDRERDRDRLPGRQTRWQSFANWPPHGPLSLRRSATSRLWSIAHCARERRSRCSAGKLAPCSNCWRPRPQTPSSPRWWKRSGRRSDALPFRLGDQRGTASACDSRDEHRLRRRAAPSGAARCVARSLPSRC